MTREPVNTDDPQMTAYALGELSIAESVEFEAKLKESPIAARELSEMNAVMGLLSKGLTQEWANESNGPVLEEVSNPPVEESSVVVEGAFGPVKKSWIAAAAAVAMAAIVGGSVVSNPGPASVDSSGMFAMSAASQNSVEPANTIDRNPVTHVPRLFLAEEVDNIGGLQLATNDSSIDATYLDASNVIPASYKAESHNQSGNAQGALLSRLDSYLPPVADDRIDAVTIENRLGERIISSSNGNGAPVFVRGFVSMDGSNSPFDKEGLVLAGFKPVSISGNPVQAGEMDLEILSKLSGVQRDLERIVSELPASDEQRAQLIQILNRNREAVSDLKREFSN